jgi:hypothetical protein
MRIKPQFKTDVTNFSVNNSPFVTNGPSLVDAIWKFFLCFPCDIFNRHLTKAAFLPIEAYRYSVAGGLFNQI